MLVAKSNTTYYGGRVDGVLPGVTLVAAPPLSEPDKCLSQHPALQLASRRLSTTLIEIVFYQDSRPSYPVERGFQPLPGETPPLASSVQPAMEQSLHLVSEI